MKFTLSNGLQVEQIQRDGFMELVCAGNPDKVLTQVEWDDACAMIVAANRKRLQDEKAERHAASIAAFRAQAARR
jgi:hypothetical protein